MPWSETSPMDERFQFVADVRSAHKSMTTLCERYGISRKTGRSVRVSIEHIYASQRAWRTHDYLMCIACQRTMADGVARDAAIIRAERIRRRLHQYKANYVLDHPGAP